MNEDDRENLELNAALEADDNALETLPSKPDDEAGHGSAGGPVPELTPNMLPASVWAFAKDVSDRQGSPPAFIAASILSAYAGMIGNTIRVRPKSEDDWEIAATLWAMLVGEPSQMKSPALAAGTAPLQKVEALQAAAFDADRDALVAQELERYKKRDRLRRVQQAVRNGDEEAALELLSEAVEPEHKLHRPRIIVHDISSAKLVELLGTYPQGLFMIQDELPRLLSRLMSKTGAADRALFLQLFNGLTSFTYDRVGRPEIRISAATLSLAGTIQPARLVQFVRDSVGQGDDGFLARFQLAIWPDAGHAAVPNDKVPDRVAITRMQDIFDSGYTLSRLQDRPRVLRFSPDAQIIYNAWAPAFRQTACSYPGAVRSHLVKLERTICILALLFELMDGNGHEISSAALGYALQWAPFLQGHAVKILNSGKSSIDTAAAIWTKRALLPSPFSPRDIYRAQWRGLDKASVGSGLARLERMGRVVRQVRQTGGRPSVEYTWQQL